MYIFANYQDILSILLTRHRVLEWGKPVNWLQYVLPPRPWHLNLHRLNPMLLKWLLLQRCQISPREVQILHCFAEVRAVHSHIAQYYVNLWMHFLATRASIGLLCYRAGRTAWRSQERWGRRWGALSLPHHVYLSLWHISSSSPLQNLQYASLGRVVTQKRVMKASLCMKTWKI